MPYNQVTGNGLYKIYVLGAAAQTFLDILTKTLPFLGKSALGLVMQKLFHDGFLAHHLGSDSGFHM